MHPIITTSWDDGHPSDLRVAELLSARGLAGTFYVPVNGFPGKPRLHNRDLRSLLHAGHEVGAHTVTHPTLTTIATAQAEQEIAASKTLLQDTLGEEVRMFCYPNGRYNRFVVSCVRRSGFHGARTTRMLAVNGATARFAMPVTLQAFPHRSAAYLRNALRARDLGAVLRYSTRLAACRSWVDLGKRLFDRVLDRCGVWHLYGHSWEIDQHDLWSDLAELLDYVAGRPAALYRTNSQTLAGASDVPAPAGASR